jgi:MoxR-like ATPase
LFQAVISQGLSPLPAFTEIQAQETESVISVHGVLDTPLKPTSNNIANNATNTQTEVVKGETVTGEISKIQAALNTLPDISNASGATTHEAGFTLQDKITGNTGKLALASLQEIPAQTPNSHSQRRNRVRQNWGISAPDARTARSSFMSTLGAYSLAPMVLLASQPNPMRLKDLFTKEFWLNVWQKMGEIELSTGNLIWVGSALIALIALPKIVSLSRRLIKNWRHKKALKAQSLPRLDFIPSMVSPEFLKLLKRGDIPEGASVQDVASALLAESAAQASDPELPNKIEEARRRIAATVDEIGKVIVGQRELIVGVLAGLLTGGHILAEGVPGIGKTTIVRTVAAVIDGASFNVVQGRPDMLPAEIIGSMVLQERVENNVVRRSFEPTFGPIFANIVLGDEINRMTPKAQSAFLSAMQEGYVVIGGKVYKLPKPFAVLATQNPIEQEGVYPLPEAQLDRFMMKIVLNNLQREQLIEVAKRHSDVNKPIPVNKVITLEQIKEIQDVVAKIRINPNLMEYMANLVLATRPAKEGVKILELTDKSRRIQVEKKSSTWKQRLSRLLGFSGEKKVISETSEGEHIPTKTPDALKYLRKYIKQGASPRAMISFVRAAQVRALSEGRDHVVLEDIQAVAYNVLRHRIVLNYTEEDVSVEAIIKRILEEVEIPKDTQPKSQNKQAAATLLQPALGLRL